MRHHLNVIKVLLLLLRISKLAKAFDNYRTVRSLSTGDPIISEEMYDCYPNLWLLNMSNQNSYEFPVNRPFLCHQRLVRFICNRCSIHSIYRKSLSKLPSLSHLELRDNGLSYIHPDAFEHNTLLDTLLLSNNFLKKINPEATLHHLSQLVILDVSHNAYFDLNELEFTAKGLVTFTCHNCAITILKESTMAKIPRLYNLTIPNNHLKDIEENAFAASERLRTLNIDGNRELQKLNIHSASLRYLSAQNCNLEGTLDTTTMPELEEINVRGNYFVHINEHGFEHNPAIRTILLDDNEIKKIPSKLLSLPLNQLRVLCLDMNPLQPTDLANVTFQRYKQKNLRNMCLNDESDVNKFEDFLPNQHGVALYTKRSLFPIDDNATSVELSNKNIVVIEQDFLERLESVNELKFDNNAEFNFKPHQAFLQSTSLTRLSIQNCSITNISHATFKELPNLRFLDLAGNQIRSLTNSYTFKHNKNLEHLSLAQNRLEILHPDVFQDLRHLKTLHLEGNKPLGSDAGMEFLISYSLEELHCNHCGFSHLDNVTVSSLRKLTKLDLAYNEISTIHATTFQWNGNLQYVDLRGNDILALDPITFKLPSHLSKFCIASIEMESSNYNESHVTKESIVQIVRSEDICEEGDMSRSAQLRSSAMQFHPLVTIHVIIAFSGFLYATKILTFINILKRELKRHGLLMYEFPYHHLHDELKNNCY